ncbi:MAG TPA: M1 family aminopeptidase [Geobacteraceae bacterium]|nr:M1 family aminopeptidase [Geobacteraceae bacterium]
MILKLLAPLLGLILSLPLAASCDAGAVPLLLRQEIAVTIVPDSHEVIGESTVTVRPHGAARISFSLNPAAQVERCTVNGKAAPFTFADGLLAVTFPPGQRDVPAALVIDYRCAFNDRPPADAVSGEDPTYGVKGVVSHGGVFLGPDAAWYPAPDAMPKARSVRVTAPAGMEAVTAGRLVSRSTAHGASVSLWEEARPAIVLSLSAGPYRISERKLGKIPIYTYIFNDDADLAERYLEASARYIKFYEELLGPYPFEKFAVVENFFPTGYGFPSYTLLGGTVIRLPFIPDTSLPHEISHSWWGNGVLVDYRQGNWSEGLAVYTADYLLQERKSAAAGRDYRLRVLADYASLVPPDRDFPLREFMGRVDPASRTIGYSKGAMVFHMIRQMIGDKAFFSALRDICREKLFKRASWGDFMGAFSRASGRDLTGFGKEWLNRKGGPRLSLAGVTMHRSGREWTISGEVAQGPPVYHLPLHLRVETAGGDYTQAVNLNRERTPFTFSVPAEPRRLLLDPDAEIFRILSPGEIPPTVNRIKGSESLTVVITASCRADGATIKSLLGSLGQQRAAIIREQEADIARLGGHDLLFCGPPDRLPFTAGAAPVNVSRQGFTIGRHSFASSDDALFLVVRHPTEGSRVAALFFPLSGAAAARAVPKITHYGTYSYLAFVAGENREKGITPALSAASVVEFAGGGVK